MPCGRSAECRSTQNIGQHAILRMSGSVVSALYILAVYASWCPFPPHQIRLKTQTPRSRSEDVPASQNRSEAQAVRPAVGRQRFPAPLAPDPTLARTKKTSGTEAIRAIKLGEVALLHREGTTGSAFPHHHASSSGSIMHNEMHVRGQAVQRQRLPVSVEGRLFSGGTFGICCTQLNLLRTLQQTRNQQTAGEKIFVPSRYDRGHTPTNKIDKASP